MYKTKLNNVITVFILLLAITGSPILSRASGPVIENPDVKSALKVFDAWLQYRVQHQEIPAVSVGIVYDQELIWAKGYGYADIEKKIPATPSTLYRIASLTKLFTATAILMLRDTGKLQLDDPVANHLDWFRFEDKHSDSPIITIRHMLTHISGLTRELETLYWDDMHFPDKKDFIRMFQSSSSIFPRETEYKYSNVAYAVLGHVIESVTQESYSDFITNCILKPLNMTKTEVLPQPDTPDLATGYEFRKPGHPRAVEPFTDMAAMLSAGNIASSVVDLLKFLSLHFQVEEPTDNQIIKGSTLKEMQRVHWLRPDWKSGRGLGWGIYHVNNQVKISHTGYVPGHTSSISAIPEDKIGVVVLTNAGDGDPSSIADQVWNIVAPMVKKATEITKRPPSADSSWVKYEGIYEWFDGSVLQAMLLNDGLALIDPASNNPWEDRIRLDPIAKGVFKMINQWQAGELIRFEENESGEITHIIMPGYSLKRIK
jgi:D-alanyl-D-alanine carboxypeptidase